MADIRKVYTGMYLPVTDLPEKPHIGKIKEEGTVDFTNEKDGEITTVLMVRVEGLDGRIRVNPSNARRLAKAWGNETEGWIGKKVAVSKVRATVFGKLDWAAHLEPVVEKKKGER